MPADFDRDGDIDMFVFNNAQAPLYLENRCGDKRHWSVVQLRGTLDNTFGLGARVWVTSAGSRQMREIHAGSGYLGSPPPEAHFGLADAETIARIDVRWPNGTEHAFEGIEPNRVVIIEQSGELRYADAAAEASASGR